MRVALANWTSRHVGGIETYVGWIARALAQAGHDVFFVHELATPGERPAIAGLESIPSACFATSGREDTVGVLRSWNPDVVFVQRLADEGHERALLSLAPSVFFAHDYQGLCISGLRLHQARQDRACGLRFDAKCLARFYPYRCGGRSPLTMWTEFRKQTATLNRLSAYGDIACFSEQMRALYLGQGFAADRVHRLPPVDSAPGPATIHREKAAGGYRLLFMGRLERVKGCHVLIDALPAIADRLNDDVILVVAGHGPDDGRCRERAAIAAHANRRVKILFLGWQSREQCATLLADSNAVVVPSLWPEPLGLVGLEALHAGVPVAAFRVGAIPEWLQDGISGALAPADPPTADGLATAITRCLTSEVIRQGASAARGKASTNAAHVSELCAVFRGALARAS